MTRVASALVVLLAVLRLAAWGETGGGGQSTTTATVSGGPNASRRGLAIDVVTTGQDAGQAFADLCAGRIDLVDAPRDITVHELAACSDNALEVVGGWGA